MLLKRNKEPWVVKGGRSPLQKRFRKELSQKLGLQNGEDGATQRWTKVGEGRAAQAQTYSHRSWFMLWL